jgi:hypothetical protein
MSNSVIVFFYLQFIASSSSFMLVMYEIQIFLIYPLNVEYMWSSLYGWFVISTYNFVYPSISLKYP